MKKRKKSALLMISFILLALLLSFSLNSCYDDYGLTTSDFDIVVTRYNKEANFNNYKTFAMPDTIFHIIAEGQDDDISRRFDSYILSKIRSNLESRGFTRIIEPSESNKPDAVVFVFVTTSTHKGAIYYPPSWGWWPGWGYPGWGWGYPPYWGGATYYSYSTGSIFIQFGDVNDLDEDNQLLHLEWLATINGLLSSNAASTQARIGETIDRAFSQSTYLQTN